MMRLFRGSRREYAVTTMLRHMEHGRFPQALRALRRWRAGPWPPPHALWRLGRWCLEKSRPRWAKRPLEIFLELYPGHQDRPEVMRDLARAHGGPKGQSLAVEALSLGAERDSRRQAQIVPNALNGS